MKSLCILADDYPSEGRPVFAFVKQLVDTLVDLGEEISVIAPQSLTKSIVRRLPILPKEKIYKTKKGNEYKVYRPYSFSFGNKGKKLVRLVDSFNQRGVDKVLSKLAPDILYGHFWHSAYKLLGYATTNNKPLFVACGEGDDALEQLVSQLGLEEKETFKNAVNGVISVSSENKRKCIQYGLSTENNTVVYPNCVDDTLFFPHEVDSLKKDLGITKEDFTIAFTGAFIQRKGADRLAEAINKLDDNNIKSIFIGKSLEPEHAPKCDGIVKEGVVEHDEIPDYLNVADVFVLPTLKEGCSNAIVEALACGLPVISSNRPFNDDILNDNNSILIDPLDVDAIAEAIHKMKTDKAYYNKLREYTLSHSNDYSIVERAKRIRQFICKMIIEI